MTSHMIKTCYLCGNSESRTLPGKVRDIPTLDILECTHCGLVYLDSHDHITSNYYNEDYDKEVFDQWNWQDYLNHSRFDDERRASQILPLITNRSYLDVGCGAGGVLLKVKDACKTFAAIEPMKRWQKILKEKDIEVFDSPEKTQGNFDVISLFHVLEHVPDPISFLKSFHSKLSVNGTIIIEVPSSEDALLTLFKSVPFSEFTYWSPHLYLFNPHTLGQLVTKAGYEIVSNQQYQRYPLSNHLKWLAKGEGGGHIDWSFLDSPELTSAYAAQLARLGKCDTLIVWAKKKG